METNLNSTVENNSQYEKVGSGITKRDQLRKAQLYITNEIKRVCDSHNIHYFLDCGTLIGAVRHKGFIPWDDDVDLGMLREDYEEFLAVAPKEFGEDFFIDNYDTNPDYALVFSKVRLKGTKYIEAKGNADAKHNEIFVDIFPYYEISDNERQRKIEGLRMGILAQAIMSKSGYKVWMGDGFKKRLKFIPTDIIGALSTKDHLYRKINNLYNKHKDARCVCIQDGYKKSYLHWYIPKEYLTEFVEVDFEGYRFPIPKHYHEYLTIAYGDYMTIPPAAEQTTHMIQELDIGKYKF